MRVQSLLCDNSIENHRNLLILHTVNRCYWKKIYCPFGHFVYQLCIKQNQQGFAKNIYWKIGNLRYRAISWCLLILLYIKIFWVRCLFISFLSQRTSFIYVNIKVKKGLNLFVNTQVKVRRSNVCFSFYNIYYQS